MATIIFKPTERCNSNCGYCDVVVKRQSGASMSIDLLELMFVKINEYLTQQPTERISIVWHGGEPLLLGAEYFVRTRELQDKHCPETMDKISHSIQSNLTLFTEEFVEPFKKLGISSVGTSYDPEPHVRGAGEEIDSESYNRLFLRAIALLKRFGFAFGIIYVATRKSLSQPLNIFHFLTNLQPMGAININPVLLYDDGRDHLAITPEEFVDFMGAIFPVWWRYQHRYPHVEPFRSLTSNIRDRRLSLCCCDADYCAYTYLNIGPLGETSQCGRAGDWNILDYGNIADRSLDELFHDQQRVQLDERSAVLKKTECQDCRFWTICYGGCPLDSYSRHQSFMHRSEWCEAKKGFIERYFEPITGLRFEPYE